MLLPLLLCSSSDKEVCKTHARPCVNVATVAQSFMLVAARWHMRVATSNSLVRIVLLLVSCVPLLCPELLHFLGSDPSQ
jgi:hypothetical protein